MSLKKYILPMFKPIYLELQVEAIDAEFEDAEFYKKPHP